MVYQGLSAVEFGHIAAEEEAAALQRYFVETKEFSDVVSDRGKLLVIGRKGSGKSAIYVAIRDVDFQARALEERKPERERTIMLYRVLAERFNEEELRTLSFNLGIDYADLPAQGRMNKARELVRYLERHGDIPRLIELGRQMRLDIPWDEVYEEAGDISPRLDDYQPERVVDERYRIRLRQILAERFAEEELRTLCFDLGLYYGDLPGQSIAGKTRELVSYLHRRARTRELVEAGNRLRPDIPWNKLLKGAEGVPSPLESSSPEHSSTDTVPQEGVETVVEALTLQDYPWEVHKRIRDTGAPAEQAYVSSWKYIIWVLLAKKLLSFDEPTRFKLYDPLFWKRIFNTKMRYLHRFLKQNYGSVAPAFSELIADRARQIRSLKVKDFEVGAGVEQDASQRLSRSINAVNRALESHVLAVLPDDKRYYLLFDQLDLGWDDTEETKQLLIGLIIAARDVMRAAGVAGKQVRVVLFLRSDIYASLRFEDKNKLLPSCVELKWDKSRLRQLVSRRIEVSAGGTWEDVFTGERTEQGKDQLDCILERTMLRPRDMIQFCVYAREAALKLNRDRIDSDSVRLACQPYSDYVVREIQDECKASVPEIDTLFAILKEIGCRRITRRQLRNCCESREIPDWESALQQLVRLSILGICPASGSGYGPKVVFRYHKKFWEHLESTQELVVHPSLEYTLGLIEPEESSSGIHP